MSQSQHFFVQMGRSGEEVGNYPVRLVKALSIAQIVVAVVAIVPHFCIWAMDAMAFEDVGAGVWSCVGYMVAGALGLSLSMGHRVSRLHIAFHIVALVIAATYNTTLVLKSALGSYLGDTDYYTEWNEADERLTAVYRVIVVFFLAEVVLSVCATVISSRAACCPQAQPVFIVGSAPNPNPAQSQNVPDNEASPPKYEDLFSGEGGANKKS